MEELWTWTRRLWGWEGEERSGGTLRPSLEMKSFQACVGWGWGYGWGTDLRTAGKRPSTSPPTLPQGGGGGGVLALERGEEGWTRPGAPADPSNLPPDTHTLSRLHLRGVGSEHLFLEAPAMVSFPVHGEAPHPLQLWHSPSPSSCCILPAPIHTWFSLSVLPSPLVFLTHFPSPGLSRTPSSLLPTHSSHSLA